MSLHNRILVATALLASSFAHAQSCQKALPEPVRASVEQYNWTIVHPEDLTESDLRSWKNSHPGLCPGVATGNFHHNSNPTYVIALIQKSGPDIFEKVLVLTVKKQAANIEIVVPPTNVPNPFVVWTLPSRRYLGVDGANVNIPQDSFAYEQLVGASRQYYYDGSQLKSFQMSY
jgi:hypothetical protein